MRRLSFLLFFMYCVTVLPAKSEAKFLRHRPSKNSRAIQNFFKSDATLQMRERNEKKDRFENLLVRKSNLRDISIYIISRSKPAERTSSTKYDNLFDADGMVYLTRPKKRELDAETNYIEKKVGRRSYDLSKKNRRKLMAMMNRELNRQLLAKANQMRRNNYEVDFDDLVV